MTKKGLSLEQKREKILQIFLDSDDVYQLKEIEKEGAKRGVVAQSIKEVVQSLVDDNLVHQEKIGSANFLWAFAAEASTKVRNEEEALKKKLAHLTQQNDELEAKLSVERSKQDDVEQKVKLQAQLDELTEKKAALCTELSSLETVSPERYQAMKEAAVVARDSANRWLDNIEALQDWVKKKFPGRDDDIDKFFEEAGYHKEKASYV